MITPEDMGKGRVGEDAVDEGHTEKKRKQPVGRRHGCQEVGIFQRVCQPWIRDDFPRIGSKQSQKIYENAGR